MFAAFDNKRAEPAPNPTSARKLVLDLWIFPKLTSNGFSTKVEFEMTTKTASSSEPERDQNR